MIENRKKKLNMHVMIMKYRGTTSNNRLTFNRNPFDSASFNQFAVKRHWLGVIRSVWKYLLVSFLHLDMNYLIGFMEHSFQLL